MMVRMTATAASQTDDLYAKHSGTLRRALAAIADRGYWSNFPKFMVSLKRKAFSTAAPINISTCCLCPNQSQMKIPTWTLIRKSTGRME